MSLIIYIYSGLFVQASVQSDAASSGLPCTQSFPRDMYYSDEVSSESSDLESDTPSPPYSPLSPMPISTSTSSSLSGELDDSDNVAVPSDATDASDAFHGQEGFLPISDSGHQAMSQLHPLNSERPARLFYKKNSGRQH